MRGVAALVVALHHATYYFVPAARARVEVSWLEPGKYGVLVFFLVSGYIVPASLERHGRVRNFWISRLFRIYPLLLVACALTLLPFLLGVRGLRGGLEQYNPVTATLAHLTMLQDVLAVPNAINVLWTLSYEMVFYLLVVALFVTGAHRRSAPVALLFAVAALAVGALLPTTLLSRTAGVDLVVAVSTVVLVAAIAAAVTDRPVLRVAGGVLGGVLALGLVVVNGRAGAWEGLVILAVMFTGTALYRAEHGQISRRAGALAAGGVLVAAIAAGCWNARTLPADQASAFASYWSGSVLLAALTFAAGWALLRHRRIPRVLTGLGTISFSVYLLHPVLLMAFDQFGFIPEREDPLRLLIFVVMLLVLSWAAYRWIEAPAQNLGRRLARRGRT
ncbi:acyltransferase [Actinomadura craniellae]|uniref:Acyltransferase n=1 Tax=Actinomadura craniellae TaxID=2231787 RepID=A0A365H7F1_9ACTN|nr:acyltransferase [Actinomadura craniellae]